MDEVPPPPKAAQWFCGSHQGTGTYWGHMDVAWGQNWALQDAPFGQLWTPDILRWSLWVSWYWGRPRVAPQSRLGRYPLSLGGGSCGRGPLKYTGAAGWEWAAGAVLTQEGWG